MITREEETKVNELKQKLAAYEERLQRLLLEEDKAAGARYGNEFLQNRVKVYEDIIRTTKLEIIRLKKINCV